MHRPSAQEFLLTLLDTLEWVFTALFTTEYLARLACVERPLRYARSFFGVVDLVAVLPTYLAAFFPEAALLIDVRIHAVARGFGHGRVELWAEDGEIVFRHALSLPGSERPTLASAASMIDAAMEAADRFYPAFDFLVQGRTPDDAMAACMFETVGQA